ncbi:unnamed protein product [Rotaria sp. Silwood2]|nr:unnamed protein product [Rotaria sp. Silwood2]
MSKTSKDLDFSSIITQVSKDDDKNRSMPLSTTVVTSGTSQTTNGTKTRSTRKQRIASLLLCCLGGSCRRRQTKTAYSSTTNTPADHESNEKFLLPILRDNEQTKICLVIDLDETLVHSVFRPVSNADFVVPVEIDGQVHQEGKGVELTKRQLSNQLE